MKFILTFIACAIGTGFLILLLLPFIVFGWLIWEVTR